MNLGSIGLLVFSVVAASGSPTVLQRFEGDGFGSWKADGQAFGLAPVTAEFEGVDGLIKGFAGAGVACSAHGGNSAVGRLTSPEFVASEDYLAFLVGGGDHPGRVAVQLLEGGKVLKEVSGDNSLVCRRVVWDVREWKGHKLQLRIVDQEEGAWGFILADHFILTSKEDPKLPEAISETSSLEAGLVASDEVAGLTIPAGTKARVVADHESQKVKSPTALAFDEKGDLYVTETHRFRFGVEDDRDHLYWYLDDLASRTVEDRAKLMEKWREKVSLESVTEKSELVRRLSGQDETGVFTRSEVFATGFNDQLDGTAAGVFPYEGTVFLANIPKIYGLRDTSGDGEADTRQVIQDGFGVRISLSGHDANGFALSPDGRIYGTVGDRGYSFTTREGVEYDAPNEGAVFRFDPDGSNFEVIHTGLRNPKEIAFDELGNAISVDNNSDQGDEARIVYIVEGGDSGWRMEHQAMHTFHREIGLEQRPASRWMDERMWEMKNSAQPAYMLPPVANLTTGPSGLTYHPGTGFLESEAGRFLICDYRGGAAASGIWSFALAPSGAGMKLLDSRKFNWGAAVTDVVYSWDGRLLVSDFMGGWKSHDDGRIYELSADEVYRKEQANEAARLIAEGFEKRDSKELVALVSHDDMRVRTRAQLALTRKEDAIARLAEVVKDGEGLGRLHGIWGLGVIARRGGAVRPLSDSEGFVTLPGQQLREKAFAELLPLLAHEDPEVRAQSVKVLGESGIVGERMNLGLLMQDDSPRVRMFAAITAGKTGALGALSYVWEMLIANADKDPYLRHAGVYAMELLSQPMQLAVLNMHNNPSLRLAAVIALGRMKHERIGGFLGDSNQGVVNEAVRLIHDRGIEAVRPLVAALLDQDPVEERSEMIWRRLLHSAYRLGDAANLDRVLRTAMNPEVPTKVRAEALRLLAEWNKPHVVDQSIGVYSPLPERDPKVARVALQKEVGEMMSAEAELLGAAIDVVVRHGLDCAGVPTKALEALVADKGLPGAARGKVLSLLVERKPENLLEILLAQTSADSDLLAIAATRELVQVDPEAATEVIAKAVNSKSHRRQQAAWEMAAEIKARPVGGLIAGGLRALIESKGVSPSAIELLMAAETRAEPEVKEALAVYKAQVEKSTDSLAEWRVALEGGDRLRGAQLFESHPAGQCMRCHSDGGHDSGSAGPDLAGVGNRSDRESLLESLINPGATVAAGYGLVSVSLKDGSSVGGVLLSESDNVVEVDVAGEVRKIARAEISSITEPVSAMPPMGLMMKSGEIRDLVEWLSSRREK